MLLLGACMKKMLTALLIWACLGQGAWAQSIEDRLLAALQAQGFVILEKGMTFFGRLRILAINDTTQREIVINPETGEILRDYAVLLALVNTNPSQSQSRKPSIGPTITPPRDDADQNIAAGDDDNSGGVLTIEGEAQGQTPRVGTKAGDAGAGVMFLPSPLGNP